LKRSEPAPSKDARTAWEHALPHAGQDDQLVLAEVPQEALAHTVEVRRPCRRQHLGALLGQHGVTAAPVVGAMVARDQPVVDEPVDQPRHPRTGEQHGVGQLGHPALAVRRRLEGDQHLIGAERKVVGGGELGVERFHQRRMDAQQAAPRSEFRGRQIYARCLHCHPRHSSAG
jgi:hypothetical protein